MTRPGHAEDADHRSGDDRLLRVREQLSTVGDLPIAERVEVFTALNDALVAELTGMEEVDSPQARGGTGNRGASEGLGAAGDVSRTRDLGIRDRGATGDRAREGSRHEGPPAS